MKKQEISIATVVLAGGQGTRLYPLTINHCKPAVSYGGRYRLIDVPISNAINSNFRQIFVIAQYLSDELQHHIQQTYHFDAFNPGSVDVLTPQVNEKGEREWFEGTADAVRKNLHTLLKSPADYFLILSGDQLYNIHFHNMVSLAVTKKADLTIASLFVSEQDAPRFGILKIDEDHKVCDFCEKPKNPEELARLCMGPKGSYIASMGIYLFRREPLVSLLEEDKRSDFGRHLIQTALQKCRTYCFLYKGYWEDIGTVSSYYNANLVLVEPSYGLNTYDEDHPIYTRPTFLPGPRIESTRVIKSIICEGSIIEAAEIEHSVIGLRSYIRHGTVIRHSVLMGNHFYMPPTHDGKPVAHDFGIGANCLIEKAIIDEHVQIGNNVKLINREKRREYDGNGIFVRDGVIVVISGTRIPDGFEL